MKQLIIIVSTLFCLAIAPLSIEAKTLEQAVKQVKKKTGGRILSAKTEHKGKNGVHKIKVLLPSGKVKIITVKE